MTDAGWLNDDEMRFWRGFIAGSSTVLAEIEAGLKADAGITFDDYEVLVHLSEAPERSVRMSDLSERVLNSRSRLSQRIDRMAARGLVTREKCPDDKRGTFAVLTDEGFAAIANAAPEHVRVVREQLIDKLTPAQIRAGGELFDQILADDPVTD